MAPIAWETIVGRVRVAGFSVSLDGYGAGPEQGLDTPLGKGGPQLFGWFFGTKTFRAMTGRDGGSGGVDEGFAHRSMDGFGAFILGRNMFGPERGPWPDSDWKGWWGDNPPYHAPTYILTHHPRDPIVMEGGTTFHFVTDGIHAALDLARGGGGQGRQDRRRRCDRSPISGSGPCRRGAFCLLPVLLGQGEAMFAGLDLPALGYLVADTTPSDLATHVVLARA
jgi:dihydrofolate reductase